MATIDIAYSGDTVIAVRLIEYDTCLASRNSHEAIKI